MTEEYQIASRSVWKTSTLKPFEIMQASVRSGTNIVNVQIPGQVITNVNSKEFKPADTFD